MIIMILLTGSVPENHGQDDGDHRDQDAGHGDDDYFADFSPLVSVKNIPSCVPVDSLHLCRPMMTT